MRNNYTLPKKNVKFRYYQSALLLLFAVVFFPSVSIGQPTMMPLPPQTTTYSGMVRGFLFTAPVNFNITGVRVPAGAGPGAQSIQIVRINDPVPVVWPTLSTNFTTLYYINNAPNGVIQNVNIPVVAGDIIGVLGQAGTVTAYGGTGGVTTSAIFGNNVTLHRFLHQANITATPAFNYSTENNFSLGLVELYYGAIGGNNAGTQALLSPSGTFCPGQQDVRVVIANNGVNTINNLTVNWEVNGVPQAPYSYTGPLNPIGSPLGNLDTVLIGQYDFPLTPASDLKIWTSNPNNVADTINYDDTISVSVQPSSLELTSSLGSFVCSGSNVPITLSPSSGYGNATLQWQTSPDSITYANTGTNTPSHTLLNPTAPTWVTLSLTANGLTCHSDTLSIVPVSPQVLSVTDSSRCGPGSVVLSATAAGDLNWYANAVGGTPLYTGANFATPYLTATTSYYVAATAGSQTALGCEGPRQEVTAYIREVPVVDLGYNEDICGDANQIYTLDAGTQPGNYTILWDDNSTASTRTIITSGTYYVTVTSEYGCVASDTVTKNLLPNPVLNIGGGDSTGLCIGLPVVLDAENPGSLYFWNTGSTSQTIEAATSGQYSVIVTNSYNCSAADTIEVVVEGEMPSFDFVRITNDGAYTFSFTVWDPSNIVGYHWDFGDGNTSTIANPSHTYDSSGTYYVVLTVISVCGEIKDTSTVTIFGVSVDEWQSSSSLSLYPNPTGGKIYIQSKGAKIESISVYNILGQEVKRVQVDRLHDAEIDIDHVASGLYHLRINTDKGSATRKVEVMK